MTTNSEIYGTLPLSKDIRRSLWSCGTSILLVHGALFYVQVAFGGGAIIAKLGVHSGNPVVFELVREILSAPTLLIISIWCGGPALPDRKDLMWMMAAGLGLFMNQLCFFVGIKSADPITGSAWQSSIPVFTVTFAIAAGYEAMSWKKSIATLLASSAALFMTLYDPIKGPNLKTTNSHLFGHASFCLCSIGCSAYIVLSKQLLTKYKAISVCAWCFSVSTACMVLAALLINTQTSTVAFICADKDVVVTKECMQAPWNLPSSAYLPLTYEVLHNTLFAWWLMGWANQYAKASVVSVYTVVQPIATAAISAWIISTEGAEWGNQYGFRLPNEADGVAICVIFMSLMVMFSEGTVQSGKGTKGGSRQGLITH